MIERKYYSIVDQKLANFPAIGLLGPRQIGKTTLAHNLLNNRPSLYLDLENYEDLAKLESPIAYLESHKDKLIILDEIHRKPDIFMSLRSQIDKNIRSGYQNGQFLILGSASLDLLQQSSESLAGRIAYIEMSPISIAEITNNYDELLNLWMRGGFPRSLLASSDIDSAEWRNSFIKTYLERDIPQFSPRIPAETLRRLWVMLAHSHGTIINVSKLALSLSISGQSVSRYIDLLVDLFLVRRLMPWHTNLKKRLVRSPKLYIRDSGILHALLNIPNFENLLSNPIIGASWEGMVIDNLLSFLPLGAEAYFYRSLAGAEIDLIIKHPDGRLIAIEIKHSSTPKLDKGFHIACEDINPTHRYVVYKGDETFLLNKEIYAISPFEMMKLI